MNYIDFQIKRKFIVIVTMITLGFCIFGLGHNLRSQMQSRSKFLESELVVAIHELHQLQREILRLNHQLIAAPTAPSKALKFHSDLVQSRITIVQRRLLANREQQRLNSGNSREIQVVIGAWTRIKNRLYELQKNQKDIQRRELISGEIKVFELSLNQFIRTNQEQQLREYRLQIKNQDDALNQLTVLLGLCLVFATIFCLYTLEFIETRQRLLEEVRLDSTTDDLTKIANRRCFNQVLQQEWNRTLREGSTIALILCDIDCFKQYNDHYGHQAGDRCLHQVAQALAGGLRRSGEFLARYGGEEFVVVASNLTADQAMELSSRLHGQVRHLELEHCRSSVVDFVTISMGVAVGVPAMELNPENALTYADQALYEAKSRGRNQSCLHIFGEAITGETII